MRIQGLEPRKIPWSVRPILFAVRRMFGRVLTPYTILARKPAILWSLVATMLALDRARSVPRRLKFLVSLRTAELVGCPF